MAPAGRVHNGAVHEYGLLRGVVAAVGQAAADAGATGVRAVGLRVGERSGAVIEVLATVWPLAIEDTPCAGAALAIEAVPAVVHCASCSADAPAGDDWVWRCPSCGAPAAALVSGGSVEVAYADLELPDPPPAALTAEMDPSGGG